MLNSNVLEVPVNHYDRLSIVVDGGLCCCSLVNVNVMYKAFAAKGLFVHIQSEFWVSRLF